MESSLNNSSAMTAMIFISIQTLLTQKEIESIFFLSCLLSDAETQY